jgi:hypothetical protein
MNSEELAANKSINVVQIGELNTKLVESFGLTEQAAGDWEKYLKEDKGYVVGDYVCVYQPKVQVLDNWGWCTGSCDQTKDGCYNSKDTDNEQCGGVNGEGDPKSWLKFQNVIIVAPNRK